MTRPRSNHAREKVAKQVKDAVTKIHLKTIDFATRRRGIAATAAAAAAFRARYPVPEPIGVINDTPADNPATPRTCRGITGEPGAGGSWQFCGHPVESGMPYCIGHVGMYFNDPGWCLSQHPRAIS